MVRQVCGLISRTGLVAALLTGLLSIPSLKALGFDDAAVYLDDVKPLLDRYCARCHQPDKSKGDVNFAKYPDLLSLQSDLKTWEHVIEDLESEVMPPDGEDAPSKEVRQRLVQTLQSLVSKVDCTIAQPGRVTLRRLNRVEYSNTVRDLLLVDIHPADDFPLDDVGYGFDTIGDVLTLPPLLLEKYLTAAEKLTDRAIVVPRPAAELLKRWDAKELEGNPPDLTDAPGGGRRLGSNGELGATFEFPRKGKYVLKVRAYGEQAGTEPVKLALKVDGAVVKNLEVRATHDRPGEYEAELSIARPGARKISVAFVNDFYRPAAGDLPALDRNLVIGGVELKSAQAGWLWNLDTFDARKLAGGDLGGQVRVLASSGEITTSFEAPADGTYQLEYVAYGTQAGPEPVRAGLRVDGKEVGVIDIPAAENEPGRYTRTVSLKKGPHTLALAFLNDYYAPDDPDPTKRGDRNLMVKTLEISGQSPVGLPESHRRLMVRQPKNDADWRSAARECLAPFLQRAYRRAVRDEEVERLVNLVELAHGYGEPFERGIQVAVEAVLVNPQFLYRVELDRRKKGETAERVVTRPLTDWELASRLSYFLWSTMPDEPLMRLAREKRLQDDATLASEVRRMLADPRARALVENFGGQWLQLRQLKNVSPDKERFPGFSDQLRADMRVETEAFLESVLKENRSILDLIDSGDVFVNERLAKLYGIDGVQGDNFRRVDLPAGSPRGGLLTQASILTLTSNPTRTSPVKRGRYVLEQILGTPPPPPPPNVPELDGDKKGPLQGTLRQRLEQHRANPSCASCHNRLDPLGFGLENFDAIGGWRSKDGEAPVDASGTLPGGVTFEGVQGLKAFLKKERADQFTRNLTEKLMIYGLGRGLEPADRCAVDAIVQAAAQDSYRLSRLITEIVKSDPFRKRSREESSVQ